MNQNLNILKNILNEKELFECVPCNKKFEMKNNMKEYQIARKKYILNGDSQSKSKLLEYYKIKGDISRKFINNLMLENSILLEEFFLIKYGKKLFNYVKSFRFFQKNLDKEAQKYGLVTKKIKKDIDKIIKRNGKGLTKSLGNLNNKGFSNKVTLLGAEISEYMNHLASTFNFRKIPKAILQYTSVALGSYTIMGIMNLIFQTFKLGEFSIDVLFRILGISSPLPWILPNMSVGFIISYIITSLIVRPILDESIKQSEIESGGGAEYIAVSAFGELLIRHTIFSPFSFMWTIIYKIFRVGVHFSTGFLHYFYQKKGKAGLGKFLAVLFNGLSSLVIVVPNALIPGGVLGLIKTRLDILGDNLSTWANNFGKVISKTKDKDIPTEKEIPEIPENSINPWNDSPIGGRFITQDEIDQNAKNFYKPDTIKNIPDEVREMQRKSIIMRDPTKIPGRSREYQLPSDPFTKNEPSYEPSSNFNDQLIKDLSQTKVKITPKKISPPPSVFERRSR